MIPELLNLTDDAKRNDSVKRRCTCGKNVKDPSGIACTSSKCPRNRQSQACWAKCRCYNCKNENIPACKEGERPSGETHKRNRGCTCGNTVNKGDKNRVTCRDGIRKTKCPCVAEGVGCTEPCNCHNCGNIFQTGGVSATLSTGRKRRRETISSYKRKRASEFTASQNDPVTSGPWRLLETLCLVVCKELLVINELPRSSLNFSNLYNVIAESDKVKELSLTILRKTTAQVAAKIAHLSEQNNY